MNLSSSLLLISIGYSSRTIPNGLDLFDVNSRSALSPDDIFDKYREAIMQYSKVSLQQSVIQINLICHKI